MRILRTGWTIAVLGLWGCSQPDDATGDGGTTDTAADAADGDAAPWGARMHGTVWGPGRAFPVSGALVAAYPEPPPEIPEGPYCEPCLALPAGVPHATSAPDGAFELEVAAGATYWLSVQKGQFRRVREWTAPATPGDYEFDVERTTLPNRPDRGAGDTIPSIALVYGDYDAIQDVLAKVGLGDLDGAYGLAWGSEAGIFDVYDNSMPGSGTEHHGERLSNLIRDPVRLSQYHLILFACSYNANFSFMADAAVQTNLREWVRAGGKVYVSDYAYAVAEMPWPEFVWFTDDLHGGCVENRFPDGCNHGPAFDAPSRSMDDDLSSWLLAIDPSVSGSPPHAAFETRENWDTIGGLFASYVGDDPDTGAPVTLAPKVWVQGPWDYEPEDEPPSGWDFETEHPLTVTWPYGCGRVLYTTYHTVGSTTGGRHPGLLTQELILWYLVMELQVCQDVLLL